MRKKELKEQQLQHQLELEQVEAEKLKEVDQLKSRFFTNISHEFRTPLTLILGQVESAKERINDKVVQSKLEMAFRNGKRLLQLINQLLDLSKLESGNMQLHTEKKDLLPFLKNLCYSYRSLAEMVSLLKNKLSINGSVLNSKGFPTLPQHFRFPQTKLCAAHLTLDLLIDRTV